MHGIHQALQLSAILFQINHLNPLLLLLLFLLRLRLRHFLRDDQVQNHRHNTRHQERRAEHDGDAVKQALQAAGGVLDAVKEVREDSRDEEVADAEGERGGEDEAVAPGEVDVGEHADTGDGDAGEEEGGHAAEHWVGD